MAKTTLQMRRVGQRLECLIEDCNRKVIARRLCSKHYYTAQKYGNLPPKITSEELFFEKINKRGVNDCWIWMADKIKYGYGRFYTNRTKILAHRFSWELYNGPIPDGLCVLHHCDVPACVNPSHLFLGTHADNMADMSKKHRATKKKGEEIHNSKLTEKDIYLIRADNRTRKAISKDFGVTPEAISHVKLGKTWAHVK